MKPKPYCREAKVCAHSRVFDTHTALLEARNEPREAKYPRPAHIDHNRQDAKRLQRTSRHKSWEKSGTSSNSFSKKKLTSWCFVGEPQFLESVLPDTLAAGRTAEVKGVPIHDHAARREKPVLCVTQTTILFFFWKHLSNRLRHTTSWSNPLSREEADQRMLEARISESPAEFHVTSSASQQICTTSPKGTALLARRWLRKRDDQR